MINALKYPPFLRPASRPTSPTPHTTSSPGVSATSTPSNGLSFRPDSGVGYERSARALNKLSLSTLRRPSPAPAPAQLTPTLIQDGTYLEALSLKLSEAVSRAFAQPSGAGVPNEQLAGRRPIPAGRGKALGMLIASELNASRENPHLYRAIVRSLQRPLSGFITNLTSNVLPLLTSPSFLVPPTAQSPNPNATQLHAMAYANLAIEVLDTFDELGLGLDGDARGDGLKGTRDGLVSLVGRVVNPLVASLRGELMKSVDALGEPNNAAYHTAKTTSGGKNGVLHPSVVTLQTMMPVYSKALTRFTSNSPSQTVLATLIISVIWRAMVALSHRAPSTLASRSTPSPPGSPPGVTSKKARQLSMETSTPPSARFTIKLPPSRPPSPPLPLFPASAATDAQAMLDLFSQFPKPAAELASEAVDQALMGFQALASFLQTMESDACVSMTDEQLTELTKDLPTLIALPVFLRTFDVGTAIQGGVASLLGFSEDAYRKGCLSGFGRAEDCAGPVAVKVLDALRAEKETKETLFVIRWIEREILDA